jgi:hypothetical protein
VSLPILPVPFQASFRTLCGRLIQGGDKARLPLATFLRSLRLQGYKAEAKGVLGYAYWIGYPGKGIAYRDEFPGHAYSIQKEIQDFS